eukprot:COSAG04_NODE_19442_length_416_cov_0.880126_1_plen_138_part_11
MLTNQAPVLADYLFELIHSRPLAVLGLNNIFIVLALFLNPLFDVKLCQDTFNISPSIYAVDGDDWPAKNWDATTGGFPGAIWPAAKDLPPKVVMFRRSYESINYTLITLFLARFLCCNLANSRWRPIEDNITRAGIVM